MAVLADKCEVKQNFVISHCAMQHASVALVAQTRCFQDDVLKRRTGDGMLCSLSFVAAWCTTVAKGICVWTRPLVYVPPPSMDGRRLPPPHLSPKHRMCFPFMENTSNNVDVVVGTDIAPSPNWRIIGCAALTTSTGCQHSCDTQIVLMHAGRPGGE